MYTSGMLPKYLVYIQDCLLFKHLFGGPTVNYYCAAIVYQRIKIKSSSAKSREADERDLREEEGGGDVDDAKKMMNLKS